MNNRAIGISIYRILICFLIARSMFLYMPYADFLFGQEGLAPYERYLTHLSDANLSFLTYPFSEFWSSNLYLWGIIFLCFLFVLGVGKWFTGMVLFFALFNLHLRNHLILDGSDNVILVTLPLLILADNYKYFSYNIPSFKFEKTGWHSSVNNLFAIGLMIQVCIIYLTTGLVKAGCDVWREGTAIYYTMRLDEFKGSLWNDALTQQAFFVKLSTYGTLLFEILFPLFVLIRPLKYIILITGVFFHIGIWVFMKIDVFPWIMIATYFVFINDKEYQRFAAFVKNRMNPLILKYSNILRRKRYFRDTDTPSS